MHPDKLYIDAIAADDPAAIRFAEALGITPVIIDSSEDLYTIIKAEKDPQEAGKRILFLTRNRSSFLKACPGTRDYTCCGYKILHIGSYCTMDCSYCILQRYFHPAVLQFFTNHTDLFSELDSAFAQPGLKRIGTGEFSDSLIWEKWTDLTERLVQRFGGQRQSVLELKTKTTAVGRLEGIHHNRKTIISWSMNTPQIIASEERRTASLKARLKAAALCERWGYPLAFHFDPMVIYPDCEEAYRQVLKQLFASVSQENIVWISLGTMRFMPALKPIMERRFAESTIAYGEFIPGLDGKMRYFKKLRIDLYRRMVHWIREMAPGVTTYLCMEDDLVWRNSFGFSPESRGGLAAMLDKSAREHCNLS
jgi:spore photoproduct lyase